MLKCVFAEGCVDVVIRLFPVTTSIQKCACAAVCFVVVVHAELCCTTPSMLAAIIAEAGFVSDVINFRLESVITPSWLCSEVVRTACTLTTTSLLGTGVDCVLMNLSRLIVSSSSLIIAVCGLFWFLHGVSVQD